MTIGEAYQAIVTNYIILFVEKHGYRFVKWMDGCCSNVACGVSDYEAAIFEGDFIFLFGDIRLDIDLNIEPLKIYEWAESQEDLQDFDKMISFRDYIELQTL